MAQNGSKACDIQGAPKLRIFNASYRTFFDTSVEKRKNVFFEMTNELERHSTSSQKALVDQQDRGCSTSL